METETPGGVMRGYWAIGSETSAMPPISVMTTDSTVAKIGRSMKNRENMAVLLGGPGCLSGSRSLFSEAVAARFQRAGGRRGENGQTSNKASHRHVENVPPQPPGMDSWWRL